ncbi:MAG: ATP-dependent Clp protease proteolytic subunit [Sulfurimonas sp.]|nr:ATP-dependent Clp protease proteolytic subunit [Sulfurimonas sp.]
MPTSKHLVHVNEYNHYVSTHKEKALNTFELLKKNMEKISKFTKVPTIAYLSNIYVKDESLVMISKNDAFDIEHIILDYKERDEINVILLSDGGMISSAIQIVETLYKYFKKVNFIVTYEAHSAASMMFMSANKIIMIPSSSLGLYNTYMESPATKNDLPTDILLKSAKDAKNRLVYLIFLI